MGDAPRHLFVGIGSAHGDDQAGWIVADRIRTHFASEKRVLVRQAVIPADVLDWLNGVDHLHLCDACQTGSPPGTLHRWEWNLASRVELTDANGHHVLRSSGSHDWGVAHTLKLAERLAIAPLRVTLWGIEGRHFEPQHSLSAEIQRALPSIVGELLTELNREQANVSIPGQLPE
jgi:hydrogenase maturation protease